MIQDVRVFLKLRVALQDYVILVQLRVHRVDLPLAKGIVERLVDGCWGNTETRRSYTIDYEGNGHAAKLLVRRNILKLRQFLEPRHEPAGPVIQFILIR